MRHCHRKARCLRTPTKTLCLGVQRLRKQGLNTHIYIYVYIYIYIYVYIYIYQCQSISVSVSSSLSPYLYLALYSFVYPSLYLYPYPYLNPYPYLSMCISISIPIPISWNPHTQASVELPAGGVGHSAADLRSPSWFGSREYRRGPWTDALGVGVLGGEANCQDGMVPRSSGSL